MQLRTVCDKRLYVPITSGSFEAKISIDIQQTFFFFVTMLASLRTKFLLQTFYVFSESFQQIRKKVMFFEIWKNEKYVFSNTAININTVKLLFIRTRTSKPLRLLETRRLSEHWLRASMHLFQCSLFVLILLFILILSVYIYLVS